MSESTASALSLVDTAVTMTTIDRVGAAALLLNFNFTPQLLPDPLGSQVSVLAFIPILLFIYGGARWLFFSRARAAGLDKPDSKRAWRAARSCRGANFFAGRARQVENLERAFLR